MEKEKSTKKFGDILIQYNSPVILTYTFLSLAVIMVGVLTKGKSTELIFSVYKTSWTDPFMYVRLFTHVFGHVDFDHFISNFMIILLVGPMLEEKYGSKMLILLMTATAVATGVINILFFNNTTLLGASGIVFMFILLSSYANFEKGKIPLTLILVVVAFIGKEVLNGLLQEDNISHITHVVGGAVGGVFGYLIAGKSKNVPPCFGDEKSGETSLVLTASGGGIEGAADKGVESPEKDISAPKGTE